MKKPTEYLVVGDNNYWYALEDSLKNAKNMAEVVAKGDFSNEETDNLPLPDQIYIYKAVEVDSFSFNNHDDNCTCADCSSIS